jgi:pyroglutamyl-peptidase
MKFDRSPRILVSGFEAFGGAAVNPTALLIEDLRDQRSGAGAAGDETAAAAQAAASAAAVEVETVLLPVVFEEAFVKLEAAIDRFKPDVVLALGQAGGRDAIEVERIAVNLMDAEIADNSGRKPCDERIEADGANAYFSTLPLREIVEALTANKISARISNSAGLYVCNDLFYRLQRAAPAKGLRMSGFVHVPYLPEQTTDKPSMPFNEMKRALAIVLERVSAHATLSRV